MWFPVLYRRTLFMHSTQSSMHVASPRLPILLSLPDNHKSVLCVCESVSVSRVCSFVSFFFFFFGRTTQHAGPCLSGQGSCPYPLQRKHSLNHRTTREISITILTFCFPSILKSVLLQHPGGNAILIAFLNYYTCVC